MHKKIYLDGVREYCENKSILDNLDKIKKTKNKNLSKLLPSSPAPNDSTDLSNMSVSGSGVSTINQKKGQVVSDKPMYHSDTMDVGLGQ